MLENKFNSSQLGKSRNIESGDFLESLRDIPWSLFINVFGSSLLLSIINMNVKASFVFNKYLI